MNHRRLLAIAAFAVLSFAGGFAVALHGSPRAALADKCTLPIPQCQGGTGGGGGGPTSTPTSTPPHHHATPPGRVTNLVLNNHQGPYVKLSWTLPSASNLKKVYVLRTAASACSSGIHVGILVGHTTALRTSAVDKHAVPGTRYCYTVFVTNTAGQRSKANEYIGGRPDQTPPPRVAGVHAAASGSAIRVTWSPAPTAAHYIVLRAAAGSCATSADAAGATRLGGPAGKFTTLSATDTTAKAGQQYCYSVFPVDAKGNVQKTATPSTLISLANSTPSGSGTTPTSTPPTRPAPASKSADRLISSAAAQIVAAVGVAVIVFGLIVLGGLKLQGAFQMPGMSNSRESSPYRYSRSRGIGVSRLQLSDYDARALVIPAVLGIGVLMVVAAVAALVV